MRTGSMTSNDSQDDDIGGDVDKDDDGFSLSSIICFFFLTRGPTKHMSRVFYKWKSEKTYATVTFDGLGISAFDLKREIMMGAKKLGRGTDFELATFNAATNEGMEGRRGREVIYLPPASQSAS